MAMRIAFDHQIFGWQEYGGISRYIFELAKSLSLDYQEDVYEVSPFYVNEYIKHNKKSFKVFGIPVVRIPKTGRLVRAANAILAKPILRFIRPDIIHETYYSRYRSGPRHTKSILTVHDMIHERFPDSFRPGDPTTSEKMAAVTRADHVICVSKQTQKDLIEITGISPDKTTVVYHGLAMDYSNDQLNDDSTFNDLSYVLYVGNRDGYKNFEGLLKAIAASLLLRKNISVVCFGGGSFKQHELSLMRQLGFGSDKVKQVTGSDSLLAHLYKNAIALVYPSLYEGFGMPPLEAMYFECPVVCSNVSSIPEVVGNAGVYFDPYSIDSMRDALESLLDDSSLRTSIVNLGNQRVKGFAWKKCAGETREVYRAVLSSQ